MKVGHVGEPPLADHLKVKHVVIHSHAELVDHAGRERGGQLKFGQLVARQIVFARRREGRARVIVERKVEVLVSVKIFGHEPHAASEVVVHFDLGVDLTQRRGPQVDEVQEPARRRVGQVCQSIQKSNGVLFDLTWWDDPLAAGLRKGLAGRRIGDLVVEPALAHVRGWSCAQVDRGAVAEHALKAAEEERLLAIRIVLAGDVERSADRPSNDVLLQRRHAGAEKVARVERVIAQVLERRAVKLARAAFGGHHYYGRAQQAVFGAVIVLIGAHFFDLIGVGKDGRLSHIPGVHVPNAVQRVECGGRAHAVNRH